ncbi:hypothetical protein BC828DRAFT_403245 [Blastocladiella britannica]|nr:hypothetical protein BC828DRAFT_403245 [Blastocladiella britannica]
MDDEPTASQLNAPTAMAVPGTMLLGSMFDSSDSDSPESAAHAPRKLAAPPPSPPPPARAMTPRPTAPAPLQAADEDDSDDEFKLPDLVLTLDRTKKRPRPSGPSVFAAAPSSRPSAPPIPRVAATTSDSRRPLAANRRVLEDEEGPKNREGMEELDPEQDVLAPPPPKRISKRESTRALADMNRETQRLVRAQRLSLESTAVKKDVGAFLSRKLNNLREKRELQQVYAPKPPSRNAGGGGSLMDGLQFLPDGSIILSGSEDDDDFDDRSRNADQNPKPVEPRTGGKPAARTAVENARILRLKMAQQAMARRRDRDGASTASAASEGGSALVASLASAAERLDSRRRAQQAPEAANDEDDEDGALVTMWDSEEEQVTTVHRRRPDGSGGDSDSDAEDSDFDPTRAGSGDDDKGNNNEVSDDQNDGDGDENDDPMDTDELVLERRPTVVVDSDDDDDQVGRPLPRGSLISLSSVRRQSRGAPRAVISDDDHDDDHQVASRRSFPPPPPPQRPLVAVVDKLNADFALPAFTPAGTADANDDEDPGFSQLFLAPSGIVPGAGGPGKYAAPDSLMDSLRQGRLGALSGFESPMDSQDLLSMSTDADSSIAPWGIDSQAQPQAASAVVVSPPMVSLTADLLHDTVSPDMLPTGQQQHQESLNDETDQEEPDDALFQRRRGLVKRGVIEARGKRVRGFMDTEAAESEDEYMGIDGGPSDDETGVLGLDAMDPLLINDDATGLGSESADRAVRALAAQQRHADDEAAVRRLEQELAAGGLGVGRRRRLEMQGMGYGIEDLDRDDKDGSAAGRRNDANRHSRRKRAKLADSLVGLAADPRTTSFARSMAMGTVVRAPQPSSSAPPTEPSSSSVTTPAAAPAVAASGGEVILDVDDFVGDEPATIVDLAPGSAITSLSAAMRSAEATPAALHRHGHNAPPPLAPDSPLSSKSRPPLAGNSGDKAAREAFLKHRPPRASFAGRTLAKSSAASDNPPPVGYSSATRVPANAKPAGKVGGPQKATHVVAPTTTTSVHADSQLLRVLGDR